MAWSEKARQASIIARKRQNKPLRDQVASELRDYRNQVKFANSTYSALIAYKGYDHTKSLASQKPMYAKQLSQIRDKLAVKLPELTRKQFLAKTAGVEVAKIPLVAVQKAVKTKPMTKVFTTKANQRVTGVALQGSKALWKAGYEERWGWKEGKPHKSTSFRNLASQTDFKWAALGKKKS